MITEEDLKKQFQGLDFREKRPGTYKVLLPFFYEDGDMYDIFIEECPTNSSLIRICDYGLALMKLSYDFEIDTPHKQNVLNNIITQNRCQFDNGNIFLDVMPNQITEGVYLLAQVISKVTNMDIISKESLKSYFYEYLSDFIMDTFKSFNVVKDSCPTADGDLKVDFEIPAKKPIFIFGVNDNTKASKVVISCLTFENKNLPFKSITVSEDIDNLSKFNRNQILNICDKPYTDLDAFKTNGLNYIKREIAV